MSATAQSRSSKQSQSKQKAGEPSKVRLPQPTTEQLRMAELLQRGDSASNDAEIAEKVAELCDAAKCSEEDALFALADADNDSNRALNLLFEQARNGTDKEWQQATAKKSKKPVSSTLQPSDATSRDASVPDHESGMHSKRTRRNGARSRQNGENEQPRDRDHARANRGRRRTPRSNDNSNAAQATTEESAPLNGDEILENEQPAGSNQAAAEDHGWQQARTRNDSRSKRSRGASNAEDSQEHERDQASVRRGTSRSNRGISLVSRGPSSSSAQRGGAAMRGRSAGPTRGGGGGWRTYSRTPRSNDPNGESEVDTKQSEGTVDNNADVRPRQSANAPRRGRHTNASADKQTRNQRASDGERKFTGSTVNASATVDEWVNDEWEGGPGSWQNKDSRAFEAVSHKADTSSGDNQAAPTTNSGSSFASIVALKNTSDAVQQSTNAARSTNLPNAGQPTTGLSTNTNLNAGRLAHASSSAQSGNTQPTASVAAQPHAAAVAAQQRQANTATSQAGTHQKQGSASSSAPQNTQKIELAELLSKPTMPSNSNSQHAAASRPVKDSYGAVSNSQQSAPIPATAATNLAVGSQTQFGVGRPHAAPSTMPARSLQNEAVVMPFKVSENLSSAFQFGFSTDYVNPTPAQAPASSTAPLDTTSNRSQSHLTYSQSQTTPSSAFTQQTGAVVTQQQQVTQANRGQAVGTYGNVAQSQASYSNVPQQPASQGTANVNAATSGLNRMTLNESQLAGSSMKATANAFVPSHLGTASQQSHSESSSSQHRNEAPQFSASAQQFFGLSNQQQGANFAGTGSAATSATPHSTFAAGNQSQAMTASQSHSNTTSEPASTHQTHTQHHQQQQQTQHAASSGSSTTAAQLKQSHGEPSRQVGTGVNLGGATHEEASVYAQLSRGQSGPGPASVAGTGAGAAPTSQQYQQMFNQLAANLFGQNASTAQSAAAQSAAPPGSAHSGTGAFNPSTGAPGQAQPFGVPQFALFQSYHPQALAQAQQLYNMLQSAPQNAAQQQFAAVSQPQSAATGTPTQSTPQFGAAPQFGIGLHSTVIGGASGNQSANASSSASQATAKLLAAAASGANLPYAAGGDDQNAFGASSMFVGADYQRQQAVVPGYQAKGGSTDYPAFKPQAQLGVGVVGAPMLDKASANTYYGSAGAGQVAASNNPPPGLGSVAAGQSAAALNAAGFNAAMYGPPNPAHQYMMAQGMFVPSSIVPAAGPIGAQKTAAPTKPGFQTTGNWQPPY